MALKSSTGLINHILGVGSLKAALTNFTIDVYTGQQPASPDDPAPASPAASVSIGGLGFTPGSPTNALNLNIDAANKQLIKPPLDDWKLKCSATATGTFTWFRIKGNAADNNAASTTLIRIDGPVVGTSGGALAQTGVLKLGSLTAEPNKVISVDECNITGA